MGASGASRGRPPTGVSARADRRDDARREETPRERAANARRARRRGPRREGGARASLASTSASECGASRVSSSAGATRASGAIPRSSAIDDDYPRRTTTTLRSLGYSFPRAPTLPRAVVHDDLVRGGARLRGGAPRERVAPGRPSRRRERRERGVRHRVHEPARRPQGSPPGPPPVPRTRIARASPARAARHGPGVRPARPRRGRPGPVEGAHPEPRPRRVLRRTQARSLPAHRARDRRREDDELETRRRRRSRRAAGEPEPGGGGPRANARGAAPRDPAPASYPAVGRPGGAWGRRREGPPAREVPPPPPLSPPPPKRPRASPRLRLPPRAPPLDEDRRRVRVRRVRGGAPQPHGAHKDSAHGGRANRRRSRPSARRRAGAAGVRRRHRPRARRRRPLARRGPSAARSAILTASQCATYDGVKTRWMAAVGWSDGLATHLAASMLTGLVTTTVTNPADMIKTQMYVVEPDDARGGGRRGAREIRRDGGGAARGGDPRVDRTDARVVGELRAAGTADGDHVRRAGEISRVGRDAVAVTRRGDGRREERRGEREGGGVSEGVSSRARGGSGESLDEARSFRSRGSMIDGEGFSRGGETEGRISAG